MRIAVVGNHSQFEEFTEKFGASHKCCHHMNHEFLNNEDDLDAIFDFSISDSPENFAYYEGYEGVLLLNTIQTTLSELSIFYDVKQASTFGFNGMSTFVNRELFGIDLF